jgi:serine/threonine-protein kinase
MNSNGQELTRVLGDHDLEAEVGRGQYGVVWRGRHRQLQREVAVKQLTASSDEHAARFRREARILAQLDHPHVVRVFDYREDGDRRLIIM